MNVKPPTMAGDNRMYAPRPSETFVCRKCGSRKFRVSDTRLAAGAIRRRRVCKRCGLPMYTLERPERN